MLRPEAVGSLLRCFALRLRLALVAAHSAPLCSSVSACFSASHATHSLLHVELRAAARCEHQPARPPAQPWRCMGVQGSQLEWLPHGLLVQSRAFQRVPKESGWRRWHGGATQSKQLPASLTSCMHLLHSQLHSTFIDHHHIRCHGGLTLWWERAEQAHL